MIFPAIGVSFEEGYTLALEAIRGLGNFKWLTNPPFVEISLFILLPISAHASYPKSPYNFPLGVTSNIVILSTIRVLPFGSLSTSLIVLKDRVP